MSNENQNPSNSSDLITQTIAQYREISLLIFKVSKQYEQNLNEIQNYYCTRISQLEAEQQLNQKIGLPLRCKLWFGLCISYMSSIFKRTARKFLHFLYKIMRKIITVLGIKDSVKKSRLFIHLKDKGIIDKLNKKQSGDL